MLLLMIDADASRAITADSRALGSLIDLFVDSIDALYDHCVSNIIDVAAVRRDQDQHTIRHHILTSSAYYSHHPGRPPGKLHPWLAIIDRSIHLTLFLN